MTMDDWGKSENWGLVWAEMEARRVQRKRLIALTCWCLFILGVLVLASMEPVL